MTQFTALVRHTVRDTDGLWPDGKGGLIIILTDVDGPNSEPALARLRLRLKAEGMGAVADGPRRARRRASRRPTCCRWRRPTCSPSPAGARYHS